MSTIKTTWKTWLEEDTEWSNDVKVIGIQFVEHLEPLPWNPTPSDEKAAWRFYCEVKNRVAVQRLRYRDGDEKAALESAHKLFQIIREINSGSDQTASHFAELSSAVLSHFIRPFASKWHRRVLLGQLDRQDGRRMFRRDLADLQKKLKVLIRLFGRMANLGSSFPHPIISELNESVRKFNWDQVWPTEFLGPQGIPENSEKLREIFAREIECINNRRTKLYGSEEEQKMGGLGEAENVKKSVGFFGLALSGGGIRSATFALGALQELADRNILRDVDYLSTVSGGGYAGAFLISRLVPPVQESNEESGDELQADNAPITSQSFPELRGILVRDPDVVVETEHVRWLRNRSKAMIGNGVFLTLARLLLDFVWYAKMALIFALLAGLAFYFQIPPGWGGIVGTVSGLVFLVCIFLLDPNTLSIRTVYRRRLSETYIKKHRGGDIPKLSDLTRAQTAPYHLVCAAVNLPASRNVELRGRRSDFFIFSPLYTGSILTGYRKTEDLQMLDPGLDLSTAVAISGAAISTHTGTLRQRFFLRPLLTLLRLSYWLPNPCWVGRNEKEKKWHRPTLICLLRELTGRFSEQNKYVNVSDGGHIENLGIYELLRRRCKFILCIDGEHDPTQQCSGLVKACRFASIDMGVTIDIDVSELHVGDAGLSQAHFALGTINYNRSDAGNPQVGYLLYLKLSITGNERDYIHEYRSRNQTFPHETTADQFFDEDQFEAYRALGKHVAADLFQEELIGQFDAQKFRTGNWIRKLVASIEPPEQNSSKT